MNHENGDACLSGYVLRFGSGLRWLNHAIFVPIIIVLGLAQSGFGVGALF